MDENYNFSVLYEPIFSPATMRLMAGESESEGEGENEQDSDSEKDGEQDSLEDEDDKEQDSKKSSELKRARDEAAKYRTSFRKTEKELKDLQAKWKEIEDKDKTELQKAQERVKELEKTVNDLSSKTLLANGISAAIRHNALDPEIVARLIDTESETSVDDQIKSLVKSKPFLFKLNGDGDGGKGGDRGRENAKTSMNDLIRGLR